MTKEFKTHTTRKTKGGGLCVTFTPKMIEMLKNTHPWANQFVIGCLLSEIKGFLNPDQESLIKELTINNLANELDHTSYVIMNYYRNGFRLLDRGLVDHLIITDHFIKMIINNDMELNV